jgi:hypothetical protein
VSTPAAEGLVERPGTSIHLRLLIARYLGENLSPGPRPLAPAGP